MNPRKRVHLILRVMKTITLSGVVAYDRHHPMVTPKPTYTAWGTFWVTLMGVSASPIRIDFICRRCDERFDFIVNREELRKFL